MTDMVWYEGVSDRRGCGNARGDTTLEETRLRAPKLPVDHHRLMGTLQDTAIAACPCSQFALAVTAVVGVLQTLLLAYTQPCICISSASPYRCTRSKPSSRS